MNIPDCRRSRNSRNAQTGYFYARDKDIPKSPVRVSSYAIGIKRFFMPGLITQTNSIKTGCCPHGLPQGACPICSGMAGAMKKADFSAKPGEMSWNECAAIGAFLKAQREAKLLRQQDALNWAQNVANFQKNLVNISQKISGFMLNLSENFPPIFAKPLNFFVKNFVLKPVNFVANFVGNLQKFMNKLADISEKLNAIFGELKAGINKKISEFFGSYKKKIKTLFSIFESKEEKDDDEKAEEVKKSFRLRTFIHDLYGRITQSDKGKNEDDINSV